MYKEAYDTFKIKKIYEKYEFKFEYSLTKVELKLIYIYIKNCSTYSSSKNVKTP